MSAKLKLKKASNQVTILVDGIRNDSINQSVHTDYALDTCDHQ